MVKDDSIRGKQRYIVKQFFKLEKIEIEKVAYLCPKCRIPLKDKNEVYLHYYLSHFKNGVVDR